MELFTNVNKLNSQSNTVLLWLLSFHPDCEECFLSK